MASSRSLLLIATEYHVNESPVFFAWFQATRDLSETELMGIVRGLALLRDERSISGWRLSHERDSYPRVSLEVEAETDADAVVRASMMFVEAASAADLEGEAGVFDFVEVTRRARGQ